MQNSSTCCNLSVARCFCGVPRDYESNPGRFSRIHAENSWNNRQPVEDVMLGKRRLIVSTLGILLLLSLPLSGQQSYVTKYDLYAGYAFLNSPKIGLFENGFHTQLGYRVRTWVSHGFDYSITAVDLTITPSLLPDALQATLGAELGQLIRAGQIPATYVLTVPAHSVTNSFAIGPQFAYRHFSKVTLFIRPSIGAIREAATPQPKDPIATLVVAQLAPTGHKVDWQGFYGVGGGADHNEVEVQRYLPWCSRASGPRGRRPAGGQSSRQFGDFQPRL